MIQMTIEKWARGKFCNECGKQLEVNHDRTGLMCFNRECKQCAISCCKDTWKKAQEQMTGPRSIGFGELPANPEDRPNLNDISQGKVVANSFAPHTPIGTVVGWTPGSKDKEVVESGGTQFSTGAVRSADKAGVMYHLITPIGMRRIAETYKEGFDKYGAFNWERGMPIGDILNHAIAHIYQFLSGVESGEDDLAHAAWNLLAAMHMQETHPELDHQLRFKLNKPPTSPSEKAVHIAARVWCDESMSNVTMDTESATKIALIIDKVLKEANEKQSINTPNNQATT